MENPTFFTEKTGIKDQTDQIEALEFNAARR